MFATAAPVSFAGFDPLTVGVIVAVLVIAALVAGIVLNPEDKNGTDPADDEHLEDEPTAEARLES